MFPNLRERRTSPGSRLSGGEQQMLAHGAHPPHRRAAPPPRRDHRGARAGDRPGARARRPRAARTAATPIILVEQNFRFVAPLADRHFLLERGRVVDVVTRGRARRAARSRCTASWASEPAHERSAHEPTSLASSSPPCAALLAAAPRAAAGEALRRRREDRRPHRHDRLLLRPRRARARCSPRGWPSRTSAGRCSASPSSSSRPTTSSRRTSPRTPRASGSTRSRWTSSPTSSPRPPRAR